MKLEIKLNIRTRVYYKFLSVCECLIKISIAYQTRPPSRPWPVSLSVCECLIKISIAYRTRPLSRRRPVYLSVLYVI